MIKKFVGDAIQSYPPGTNCASISNLYKSEEEYLEYAKIDKTPTLKMEGIGTY